MGNGRTRSVWLLLWTAAVTERDGVSVRVVEAGVFADHAPERREQARVTRRQCVCVCV